MKSQMIDTLVADLTPVRAVLPRDGMALMGIATALSAILVATVFGLRPDIMAGDPEPLVVVRGGMLLVLGLASLSAVISAARPGIGQSSTGWRWALAAAAIFPITAAFLALGNGEAALRSVALSSAYYCFAISGLSALGIGAVLTLWLRRGAPTSPERTAWLIGLSAGSFGTLTYSLHCPSDTVYYVGLWYSLAVCMCTVAARIIVPRLIRW